MNSKTPSSYEVITRDHKLAKTYKIENLSQTENIQKISTLKTSDQKMDPNHLISIVIPMYNEIESSI